VFDVWFPSFVQYSTERTLERLFSKQLLGCSILFLLYRRLMSDLGSWLFGLLLLLLHWLWSIRWLIATIVWFVWFQWTIKNTVRDGVSEALKRLWSLCWKRFVTH
jgi:hypothetical protein